MLAFLPPWVVAAALGLHPMRRSFFRMSDTAQAEARVLVVPFVFD
jgi:hypothetical protein